MIVNDLRILDLGGLLFTVLCPVAFTRSSLLLYSSVVYIRSVLAASKPYTTEVYKSVAVNETSVTGNEDSSEGQKDAAPEVRILGEVGSGADTVEFEEDWSQKWIWIENSL